MPNSTDLISRYISPSHVSAGDAAAPCPIIYEIDKVLQQQERKGSDGGGRNLVVSAYILHEIPDLA